VGRSPSGRSTRPARMSRRSQPRGPASARRSETGRRRFPCVFAVAVAACCHRRRTYGISLYGHADLPWPMLGESRGTLHCQIDPDQRHSEFCSPPGNERVKTRVQILLKLRGPLLLRAKPSLTRGLAPGSGMGGRCLPFVPAQAGTQGPPSESEFYCSGSPLSRGRTESGVSANPISSFAATPIAIDSL